MSETQKEQPQEQLIQPPSQKTHGGKVILPVSKKPEPKDSISSVNKINVNIDSKSNELEDFQPSYIEPSLENLPFYDQDSVESADAQEPKIYDTKKYYIPIHDTQHKHSIFIGTIIAGILSAIIVLTFLFIIFKP